MAYTKVRAVQQSSQVIQSLQDKAVLVVHSHSGTVPDIAAVALILYHH